MTTKRLVDLFVVGERVEISFGNSEWWEAYVVQHDHPGLWVMTGDGRLWFVTNGRRIKKAEIVDDETE